MNLNALFHGCLGAYRAYASYRHSAGHTQAHNQRSVNQMSIDGTTQLWDPHYAIILLYLYISVLFPDVFNHWCTKIEGKTPKPNGWILLFLMKWTLMGIPHLLLLVQTLVLVEQHPGPTNGSLLR